MSIPNLINKEIIKALEELVAIRKLSKRALIRKRKLSEESGVAVEKLLMEAGEIDRDCLLNALHKVNGIKTFNLKTQKISYTRAQMIPQNVAEILNALPVGVEQGKLLVVLADPEDVFACQRIESITSMEVEPRQTYVHDIPEAIKHAFSITVSKIDANTPYNSLSNPSPARESGEKFVVATKKVSLESSLKNSIVRNLGEKRTIKIDTFIAVQQPLAECIKEVPEDKYKVLQDSIVSLTSPGNFHTQTLNLLADAQNICNADAASLLLLDSTKTSLYFAQAVGPQVDDLASVMLPVDEHSIAGYSVLNRTTVRVNDAISDPRHNKATDAKSGYKTRSLIATPVFWQNEPLGVLEVLNKVSGSFDDEDIKIMQYIASQAAICVMLYNLTDSQRKVRLQTTESFRDLLDLTGIQNRNFGELVAQIARAIGSEKELSEPELECLTLSSYLCNIEDLKGPLGYTELGGDLIGRIQALQDVSGTIAYSKFDYASEDENAPFGKAIPLLARILKMAKDWTLLLPDYGLERKNELLNHMLSLCSTKYDPGLKIPFEVAVNSVFPNS